MNTSNNTGLIGQLIFGGASFVTLFVAFMQFDWRYFLLCFLFIVLFFVSSMIAVG